ncbi:Myosin light chain kinase, smooth muscle [Trachymyrmex septentrionalis]|uniref:Myosin light chain kinase, smooth muscle n=2 Tax=Trachymyrmex septentrionalis TaxID=34720 RepID=A0A195ERL1_9HYME|nr:PREDICTED: myosin light chain kinase, smooth muscle-like isoform X1 [Trachymyrmex septentrionalis]KYN30816.1 Myosin light chain kinase, smooth muscle [Trachymyrmex septentrionalis]
MIRVDESDPVGEIEPSFPYRDVTVRRGVEFKDDYDIQSELGRGKFGIVYRCKEKRSGLMLAAKVVNVVKKEDRRAVQREVDIMRRLQHPRLIQLYDSIDAGKQIYVVLELIDGGELFERVIDDDFVLTERSCAVFMRQICEGIEFMHGQKILHLDLKPENILCLTKEGNRIKIIDFGLAREYDPSKKLQVLFGTPEFVAPEVVNFDQIGFGTDIWSIGVICYVLLSGLSPFMGDTDIETMANVTIAKYDFDHEAFAEISEDAKDFIRCLLVKDKEKRMTAAQCREHRWLVRKMIKPKSEKETAGLAAAKRMAFIENRPVISVIDRDELDVTKDNLRQFVERWREHPDSPYTIDSYHALPRNPLRDRDESMSLRGHSPSPCDSLRSSSTQSERVTMDSVMRDNSSHLSVPSLSLSLERRASEGTAARNRRDPASQIALAEEIIKLSEHLRSIATGSQTSEENNEDATAVQQSTKKPGDVENNHNISKSNIKMTASYVSKESNEITEKLSSITRQRKLNGTTFHSSRSLDRYNFDTNFNNVFVALRRTSIGDSDASDRRRDSQKYSLERTAITKAMEEKFNGEKIGRRRSSVAPEEMDLTPPWRRSRVKRSFGETSRDVPRISNLRDLHKNLNLDEPGSAKDLLLHLLGEWEEVTTTSCSGNGASGNVGRKSMSLDWCAADTIARKTMNSLAEYFQSKQQETKSSDVASSTSPTIYR